MSVALITHSDFDGCVAAVLFKTIFPKPEYEFFLENYDTVNERIRNVLESEHWFVDIVDISPTDEETAELLDQHARSPFRNRRKSIRLFDHHKTAQWLSRYLWATIGDKCGAALYYDYQHDLYSGLPCMKRLKSYVPLVYHANDYDLWRHESPHSSVLNSLLYTIGQERFIDRFLQNPSVELTETEKYLLQIEKEKEEKYIREAAKTAIFYPQLSGPVIAVVCAERYISQIGEYLLNLDMSPNRNADIVAIVNAQKGTVSLRSKNWDVSAIAKACGGGGHEKAAGFKLEDHWLQDDVAETVLMYAAGGEKCGSQRPE